MTYKTLTLDLSAVKTLEQFHKLLRDAFGFPDFYGNNVHALIDCLSSLRYPDEGMSKIFLENMDDVLLLTVIGLANTSGIVINNFLVAVAAVNSRSIKKGFGSTIHVELT